MKLMEVSGHAHLLHALTDILSVSLSELPIELIHLLDPHQSVSLPPWSKEMSITSRQMDQLITRLGKTRTTWRRCLVLFEWLKALPSPSSIFDERLCATLIRICSRHDDAVTALYIYEWSTASVKAGGAGHSSTIYIYEAAMKAAMKANMLKRAMDIWSEAKRSGLADDSRISTLHIENLAKMGMTDRALSSYEDIRRSSLQSSSSPPSVYIYVAAMSSANEVGRWQSALEVWDQMCSDSVAPTGHAYSSAIRACASGGLWKRASILFASMVSDGIKPDVVSCTALITSLASSGQSEKAEAILKWMLKNSVRPNERTYVALLTALAKGGQSDRAAELLFKMQLPEWGSVSPSAYVYSSLLKSLADEGKWRLAEAVFCQEEERMLRVIEMEAKRDKERAAGSSRNGGSNLLVAPGPLSFLEDQGESLGMNRLLSSLPLLSLTPSSSELSNRPSRLATPLSSKSPTPSPDSSFQAPPPVPPTPTRPSCINEVVCGALMLAYERSGMWHEAVRVISRATRLRLTPSTVMFNTAISAAGKAGQIKLMEKLLIAVKRPDAVTYETAVVAYGQCGRPEDAEMWFDRLVQAGHHPKHYAYCGLIAGYSLSGDVDKALAVRSRMNLKQGVGLGGEQKVNAMGRGSRSRPPPPSVHVYNALLAACERAGRSEEVLQLVADMKKDKVEPNALTLRIMREVGKKGVERIEGQQAALTSLSLALAAAAATAISRGMI